VITPAEQLRQQVTEAFGHVLRPAREDIATHQCSECERLRDDFDAVEWQTAPAALLEEHATDLPLFTPEAWCYFLPAYILHALEVRHPDSIFLDFLVYELDFRLNDEALSHPSLRKWAEDRVQIFSEQQVAAIIAFLQLLIANRHYEELHEDIRGALEFWQRRATENAC
jgi:hypothetical protein